MRSLVAALAGAATVSVVVVAWAEWPHLGPLVRGILRREERITEWVRW